MPTHPYIHFQGQCAEALTYYADVFGATDLQMMKYADGPGASPEMKDSSRVMHGQLTIGDGTFMASDYPPGVNGSAQSGFSVMQAMPSPTIAHQVFARLQDGGTVIEPMQATFFSPAFGMVKDKFGTHWIISTVPAA